MATKNALAGPSSVVTKGVAGLRSSGLTSTRPKTPKLESPYLVVQGFPRTFTPADVKRTLESIGVTIGPGAVPVSKIVSEPPVIRRQPQTPHHLTKSFHITFPTAPHATAALRVISSRSDLFTSLGFTPTRRGSKDSTDRDSRTGKNSLSGKGEVLEASKWWIEAWTDAYPKSHFKNPSSSNETRLSSSSSSSNTHQHQNNIHNRTLLRSDIYPILTSLQVGASSLHQELRGKQVLLRGLPGGLIKHENGHAMGKILDSFRVVDDDGILELPNLPQEKTNLYLITLHSISEAHRLVRKVHCTKVKAFSNWNEIKAEVLW